MRGKSETNIGEVVSGAAKVYPELDPTGDSGMISLHSTQR